MSTHDLYFQNETDTSVRWACRVCGRYSDFSKPGHGEPSATQFEYPENVDSYLDPCPGEYVGSQNMIAKDEFFDRFTSEELGAFSASTNLGIQGMVFRMTNVDHVDLNDPRWSYDLQNASELGCITAERVAVVLMQQA